MAERYEGEVKFFSNERGYGFIHPLLEDNTVDQTVEFFVHFTSIKIDGFKTLQPNQRVSFELKDTPKGVQAVEVEVL